MLLAIEPLARVGRSVGVRVRTLPMELAHFPEADEHIAVGLDEPAEALLLVIDEEAVVLGAIRPYLFTFTVPLVRVLAY